MKCSLCNENTKLFFTQKNKTYFRCTVCDTILLDTTNHLNFSEEKQRYDKHSDNIEDKGYQDFVSPLITAVISHYSPSALGLDYGCGNSAIIQQLLIRKGYSISGYDPIYYPDNSVLQSQYNYITCCEVAEHFYHPNTEFKRLHNLLLPKGKLFLKTNLYHNTMDFSTWWYKNDPTHVVFYTKLSLEFIKNSIGFSELKIHDQYIEFTK